MENNINKRRMKFTQSVSILQTSATFSAIRAFFTFTSIGELGLSNCRIQIPGVKIEATLPFDSYECRSVVVLKLAGTQVITHNMFK